MSHQKILITFDEYKNLKEIEKKYYKLLEGKLNRLTLLTTHHDVQII